MLATVYEETDYLCAATTRRSTEPLEGSDYKILVARQSVGSPDATDDKPAIMKMIHDVNMHDDVMDTNITAAMLDDNVTAAISMQKDATLENVDLTADTPGNISPPFPLQSSNQHASLSNMQATTAPAAVKVNSPPGGTAQGNILNPNLSLH